MGQGVFYDPNDLALSLVMIFPLSWWCFRSAASGYRRFLAFLGMLTIVGGIMAAQSRGGLLALGAAVCVLGYRSRNSLTPLAATLALTAAAVLVVFPSGVFDRYASILQYQTDESAVARLAVWKAGLQMFADHPLTGVGAGAFETVYGMYYIDREGAGNIWRAAHSSYIEVAAELGIFGLLAWLAVLASGFFTLVRARRALSMSEPAFDEQRELSNWVDAATASLVSFLVGGMFLSRAYDVVLIILLAMASVALRVSLSAHADAIDEADGDAAETPPSSD
jgi:O-antigen ligase